jgi:hypothetical protein
MFRSCFSRRLWRFWPESSLGCFVTKGVLPVGAGLLTGVLGGMAASRVLDGLIGGVRSDDPLTYGAPAAALGLAALAAMLLPARRALRVDPTVALKGH